MPELDRLVWAGSFTVAVDGVHLGVRASDRLVLDVLREALAAHVVDDPDAPPNFAIVMGRPGSTAGTRPMHALYRGCTAMLRSPSLGRTLRGLVSHLDGAARELEPASPGQSDHLLVEALATVVDGRAVLLPGQLRYAGPALHSALRRAGAELVDACVQQLDPGDLSLVVPVPVPALLQVDADAWRVAAGKEAGAVDAGVGPGRYPVAGWVLHGSGPPPSPAAATVETAGLVRNIRGVGQARVVQALTALWSGHAPLRADGASRAVAAALTAVVPAKQ